MTLTEWDVTSEALSGTASAAQMRSAQMWAVPASSVAALQLARSSERAMTAATARPTDQKSETGMGPKSGLQKGQVSVLQTEPASAQASAFRTEPLLWAAKRVQASALP